ncbi:neprilysin-2-like [Ornithodoros turicata]|uniref:neprilysin-2-like n=1 Tax=Ornithodoros turicata TaxID=34597 RepID=UPI00313980F4
MADENPNAVPNPVLPPASSSWTVTLWSLVITATVLLLLSVVVTAFVTTTLFTPTLMPNASHPLLPQLRIPDHKPPKQLVVDSSAPSTATLPRLCETTACIEQAKLLLRQLNSSRDPCEDFYSYVCDDWAAKRPLAPGAERISLDTILSDGYIELLSSGLAANITEYPEIRFLFERCLSPEPDLFDSLLTMFLEVSNKWMVRFPKQQLTPTDVSSKIGRIFRELGVETLFKFFAVKDPMNKTKRYVGLGEPSTVLLRGRLQQDEYELVRISFAPVLTFFQRYVDTDLFLFEDHLSNLLVRPRRDSVALVNCTVIKVRDLPIMPSIDWTTLLQSVFGKGLRPISRRTYIKLDSPEYIVRLTRGDIAKSTKDLLAYLLFKVMMALSPLLKDDRLRNDLASVAYARHPEFAQTLPQKHYCLRMLNRFEPNLPLYVSRHFAENIVGGKEVVEEVISVLKLVLDRHVQDNLGPLSSGLREHLQEKLRKLSWEPFLPKALNDKTFRAKYLEGIYLSNSPVSTAHFFYTWIRKSLEKSLVAHMSSKVAHPGWQGGFLSSSSSLHFPYERLEIPLPVFDFFMRSDPALRPLHLPRVGPKVYRSLFRAIYHWMFNFDYSQLRGSTRIFDQLRDCLAQQYSSLLWMDKNVQLNSSQTSWEDLWDYLAVPPAYKAFQLYSSRVSPHYRLRLLEHLNVNQLFFVYYAVSFCENSNRRFLRKEAAQGPHSPAWYRVNGPLRNMPEFARAFSCRPGSFMNPNVKCGHGLSTRLKDVL